MNNKPNETPGTNGTALRSLLLASAESVCGLVSQIWPDGPLPSNGWPATGESSESKRKAYEAWEQADFQLLMVIQKLERAATLLQAMHPPYEPPPTTKSSPPKSA